MCSRRVLALGAALAAFLVPLTGVAAAGSGPGVTVRVEGLAHTLLAPTTVRVKSGWLTRFGAPRGQCPATSANGALDVATHHKWRGKWSTSYDEYEITSILGESHSFTSRYYWEIFVNDVAASKGACEIASHSGEQLLFAAVPDTGTEYPTALVAPSSATVGHPFDVTVVGWGAKGKRGPLADATVSVAGRSGTTNSHGVISLTPSHAGTFVLVATHSGYIRSQATVRVS
jgi:uncharacterized protein DUF4430